MGIIRKVASVGTLGAVNYKSRGEQRRADRKMNAKAAASLAKTEANRLKFEKRQDAQDRAAAAWQAQQAAQQQAAQQQAAVPQMTPEQINAAHAAAQEARALRATQKAEEKELFKANIRAIRADKSLGFRESMAAQKAEQDRHNAVMAALA